MNSNKLIYGSYDWGKINQIIIGLLIISIFSFDMFFYQMTITSDFIAHAGIATNGTIEDVLKTGYPMWHLLVRLMHNYFHFPLIVSVAVVTTLSNIATYILCVSIFNSIFESNSSNSSLPYFCGMAVLALMMVGPLYVPTFNANVFLGQDSPNIWHNPTNLMVRPFAVASVWLYAKFIDNDGNDYKKIVLFSIVLALSCFAKPSFAQAAGFAFGMAAVIFVLCRKIDMKKFILIIISMLPALFIILWQFGNTFGDGGGVEIAPFVVVSASSPNWILSMILGFGFPFYVIIVCFKQIKNKTWFLITILYFLISKLESILLAEIGERRFHGNFNWAAQLSMFLMFLFSLTEYIGWSIDNYKKKKIICVIGWIIFFCHLLVGLYYYKGLKITGSSFELAF